LVQTAELILHAYKNESDGHESSGNYNHEIEACELLREINFGVLESLPRGTSVEEGIRVRAERLGLRLEEVRDHREAPHEVEQRHGRLLEFIAARALQATGTSSTHPHNMTTDNSTATGPSVPAPRHVKVLCVSHGGFIRSFITRRVGVPCESVPNCSFTEVEVTVGAGGDVLSLRLHRLNDAAHIPPEL
jgi:broad specificity phosphatase PhoE